MNLSAYIAGIGVLGPGFADWREAAAVLSGAKPYSPAATVLTAPVLLPPTERRRTGRVVKLALAVALEAASRAKIEPAALASVFSSSGGDGHNCHELCQALALADREISPTRFSNSVHNAAAGYWSIATGAKLESNVLCAYDASFCAGLLEAMTQIAVDGESLLLVAYDTEYPEPIHSKRPLPDAFGAALVLTPDRGPHSAAHIEVALGEEHPDTMADPLLEALRVSIPAARCLPLLSRLARAHAGRTVLEYLDASTLAVNVAPCS
ncbi:MAG TPA: beta-ketoacyl synthase chain length factor [Steroidobacteraceae bacterium]|nr:beta-ketoacyl synthase chain length factor [Steroidobacteraceae bacterium]